jgi:hypothetical protein
MNELRQQATSLLKSSRSRETILPETHAPEKMGRVLGEFVKD